MKILVIEDHPTELKLANHVLIEAGNNVSGLETAEHAFESIQRDKPELILLDMSLPGMDGLALVRLLKANQETRDIIVVAVTSYPERFSKALAMEAGCDAYFPKPLSTRTLPRDLEDIVKTLNNEAGG